MITLLICSSLSNKLNELNWIFPAFHTPVDMLENFPYFDVIRLIFVNPTSSLPVLR